MCSITQSIIKSVIVNKVKELSSLGQNLKASQQIKLIDGHIKNLDYFPGKEGLPDIVILGLVLEFKFSNKEDTGPDCAKTS